MSTMICSTRTLIFIASVANSKLANRNSAKMRLTDVAVEVRAVGQDQSVVVDFLVAVMVRPSAVVAVSSSSATGTRESVSNAEVAG